MRGGSFDSPTTDPPSNQEGVPTDQAAICCRPSDGDGDRVTAWRPESSGVLGCRSSLSPSASHRRTWSVACLRPLTDKQLTDGYATRSMPNVRWIRDGGAASKCVCDATVARTSGDEPRHCRIVDSAAERRISAAPPGVERAQRVTRSDPDMLKLPPSSSSSNCHEHSKASRPSSLDRFRLRRQRSLPPSRDAPLLPVNVIFPTAGRLTATVQL